MLYVTRVNSASALSVVSFLGAFVVVQRISKVDGVVLVCRSIAWISAFGALLRANFALTTHCALRIRTRCSATPIAASLARLSQILSSYPLLRAPLRKGEQERSHAFILY